MTTPADRLPGADEENIVPESDGLTADVPAEAAGATAGEPHVDADDPIARFQPGVGRDSAASSRIAQSLPRED